MKNRLNTIDYNSRIVVLLLLVTLMGCSLFESPRDCRDDVIQKVPIYPNSRLIREETNSTSEDLNWGSLTRVYETTDSLEDVWNFYHSIAGCTISSPIECMDSPDGDQRISYVVTISEQDEMVIFSVDYGWMCSRGQLSNP